MRLRCLINAATFALLLGLFGGEALAQQPLKNWYWVQVSEGPTTQFYRGTSPLSEKALLKALGDEEFLRFDNLTFVNCGITKAWSEHNPELENHVLINPRFIISVHPLAGDPRLAKKQSGRTGFKP